MKRLIACVSLAAAATTAAVPATAPPHAAAATTAAARAAAPKTPAKGPKRVAKAPPKCKVAPADEYFGKLKMSILGIRNTIKDQGLKVDYDPEKAPGTLNAISLTEDAIHDWQRKYPCDSWLPGTLYALQHFYLKIHTDDGVKHVHATFAWLRHDYPRSSFVQLARREDGQASTTPATPPVASVPAGPAPASAAPGASAAPAPLPGNALPTPFPGTAPQSVINAQNAMGATAAPTTAPHH
ncbi:MAG: hypothetical protein JWM87_802 [Candidatus Eremiobacteraeota bacterium]|nr:hypothetical protein [Candidatus Eremiobacteraeota bacterium]